MDGGRVTDLELEKLIPKPTEGVLMRRKQICPTGTQSSGISGRVFFMSFVEPGKRE